MRKTEIVLIVAAILSFLLKMTLLSGMAFLLSIIMMSLAFCYFYFGLAIFNDIPIRKIFKKESYKGISPLRIIFSICTGIALSLITIGILFKLQIWPAATLNLEMGIIICTPIIIVSLIKFISSGDKFYKKILFRAIAYSLITIILFFTPGNIFIELFYRNHPAVLKAVEKAKRTHNQLDFDTVRMERNKVTNQ